MLIISSCCLSVSVALAILFSNPSLLEKCLEGEFRLEVYLLDAGKRSRDDSLDFMSSSSIRWMFFGKLTFGTADTTAAFSM